jgi:hypothetical protein
MLGHVGGGHRCRLQQLHHDVAEIMEKSLVNAGLFGRAQGGKDLRDLVVDDPVAMPHDVISQEIQET